MDDEALTTFILQYYDNRYIPDFIITDKDFDERVEVSHLLSDDKKAEMKIKLSKSKRRPCAFCL